MYRETALASIIQSQDFPSEDGTTTVRLMDEDETEVLAFLAVRPLHTAALTGFIRDNSLCSPHNRGSFHGFRNAQRELEGVALIGHATLVKTRTDGALEALAEVAQRCETTHMIMGEKERIHEFWSFYSKTGQQMRRACRERLLELTWPVEIHKETADLRRATRDDLHLVAPVHAEMAFAESGVNPTETDSFGFLERCGRRVDQGRCWVWVEDGELIFKADIVAETPLMVYVEGVWINPKERGEGHGLRCTSQLARLLLSSSQSICVLVNDENEWAQRFYKRAGFKLRAIYDTIFLN